MKEKAGTFGPTNMSDKWSGMKSTFNFQRNMLKYGIMAGMVSTVVITAYTVLAMKLQAQEMVKNDLDIKIKRLEVQFTR